MIHNGYQIDLTRRRYGKRTFFTWINVKIGDVWQSSGDPLQKLMPSKKDLSEAIERAQAHQKAALQQAEINRTQ